MYMRDPNLIHLLFEPIKVGSKVLNNWIKNRDAFNPTSVLIEGSSPKKKINVKITDLIPSKKGKGKKKVIPMASE